MEEQPVYRHELKYQVDYGSYLALRSRLRPVMKPDPHTRSDGRYVIRSVYFDTMGDKALREKLNGVREREKFRIRWYNDDLSFITLEKKVKRGSLCQKLDAPVSEEECRVLFSGHTGWMREHPQGLVRELYAKMAGEGLKPRVLVSYLREPYVYGPGNVRVTFDSRVRTGLWGKDFFAPLPKDVSAADGPGDMLMEVKYDAFLPDIIAHLLQCEGVRQQAFSKYAAARRFG